jgi:hypothetical protein
MVGGNGAAAPVPGCGGQPASAGAAIIPSPAAAPPAGGSDRATSRRDISFVVCRLAAYSGFHGAGVSHRSVLRGGVEGGRRA